MLKTFLELIIAVTFVFSIEALGGLFTETESSKVRLMLQFDSKGFWLWIFYVFPGLVLALHTVTLAHYHQKRESWGVMDKLAKKIENLSEIGQYATIAGSIILLILATKHLSEAIVAFWGGAYLFYFLGDLLTFRKTKPDTLCWNFKRLLICMLWTDAILCVLALALCVLTHWKTGLEDPIVAWFCLLVILATIVNYICGWKFMTREPPTNCLKGCPITATTMAQAAELCLLNSPAKNQEQGIQPS
jgi:putative flippase GtrA